MVWRNPLKDVDLGHEEIQAVQALIQSSDLTIDKIIEQFEKAFADYLQNRYAFAVSNATAALHLSFLALGLKAGDEVIVPSLTSVAVANAIRYTKATPVFAEIESCDNLNISPESIKSRIGPNTRAILVFHYAGFPCDMPAILEIAITHGLFVIENAEYAVGAELSGRKIGTWADIGCFCFFSNKNKIAGEGGMLTTNNEELAQKLKRLCSHRTNTLACDQQKGHVWNYDVVDPGCDYQIDAIQAAIGLGQLSKIVRNNQRRRRLLQLYQVVLFNLVPQVYVPFKFHSGIPAAYFMPVLLPEHTDRKVIVETMKNLGIQTSLCQPPIHTYTSCTDSTDWQLPLTEDVASRVLTLPLSPTMKVRDVLEVVEALRVAII